MRSSAASVTTRFQLPSISTARILAPDATRLSIRVACTTIISILNRSNLTGALQPSPKLFARHGGQAAGMLAVC